MAGVFGVKIKQAKKALETFVSPPMRIAARRLGKYTIINDAYNSNPLSTEKALDVLANFHSRGRKIVAFGNMLELGDRSARYHEDIGKKIAQLKIDVLITAGDLAKRTAYSARKEGLNKSCIFSHQSASEAGLRLSKLMKPGDTLLVKGSRNMRMEKIVEILKLSL